MTFKLTHPALFQETVDSKGRVTLTPLADEDGNRHCGNCGDVLTSKRMKAYCRKLIERQCLECGEIFTFPCDRHAEDREFCGSTCSNKSPLKLERVKKTVQERYGVSTVFMKPEIRAKAAEASHQESAKKKREATNMERYGAKSNLANPDLNEEYRKRQLEKFDGKYAFNTVKQKETMLERYGEDHPMKVKEFRDKALATQRKNHDGKLGFNAQKQRDTMLERYGATASMSSPELKEKIAATMLERYGVDHPSKSKTILSRGLKTQIDNHGSLFPKGGSGSRYSKVSDKMADRLEELTGLKVEREFVLEGAIFDLHLAATNILVDVNPTVTHNVTVSFPCLRNGCPLPCEKHETLPVDYHYRRAVLAASQGYRLVQLYDWEDSEKVLDFIAGKLAPAIRLSARKLRLESITPKIANEFLEKVHLQGSVRGQTHCYGLYTADGLVAVGTFGKSRFKAKASHEWLRYAVAPGYLIHGGPGAIFKAFVRAEQPDSVISYVDFNHTTGPTFLESVGFIEQKATGATAVWHKKGERRIPSTTLLRLGADRLLGTKYGSVEESGLNNEGIMAKEGWRKIYTAGNRVFLWTSP